jgi:hypothetical protein
VARAQELAGEEEDELPHPVRVLRRRQGFRSGVGWRERQVVAAATSSKPQPDGGHDLFRNPNLTVAMISSVAGGAPPGTRRPVTLAAP